MDSNKRETSWFAWFSPVNWISAVLSYAVSLSVYIYIKPEAKLTMSL